jgi:hypothetical protein
MQERKRLEDIIKELPEDLRKELEDFAQFLCVFSDFADKFTSVELQHKILNNNYLKKEEDNVNINYYERDEDR